MDVQFQLQHDGSVHVTELIGPIDLPKLADVMDSVMDTPEVSSAIVYEVDLTRTQLNHLGFSDIHPFSKTRNRIRKALGDSKPTVVVASSPVLYGVARIAAALDRSEMHVFRSRETADTWIDAYLADQEQGAEHSPNRTDD